MNNNNFEMVEELVRRANVSYAEAKDTLEVCGWDMTEAMILLEKQGKIGSAQASSANTGYNKEKFRQTAENCASDIKDAVHKGNSNYFEMMYEGKVVFSIPITAAIIIGVLCINLVIPAAVIALLCGCSFHIRKNEDFVSAKFTSYQSWTNNDSNPANSENSSSSKIDLEK